MVTVKQIREKYPKPRSIRDFLEAEDYCVMGAFLMYVTGHHMPFPNNTQCVATLTASNPNLSPRRAYDYCYEIITLNDTHSNFEAAGAKLDKALTEGRDADRD
jgi:hypothetical protein